MTSVSLTKSSHINFLIWCLMAIVEGSLIFFPNRYVCIGGLLNLHFNVRIPWQFRFLTSSRSIVFTSTLIRHPEVRGQSQSLEG
jgi:hypothetical protein